MTSRGRLWLFLAGAAALAALLALACLRLPPFGGPRHPYGDSAVAAALRRHTANVVSFVNFDLRALDTLGEETILFAAVVGTVVLLRQTADEHREEPEPARVPAGIRWFGTLMLPVTLLIGLYVIAHGPVSPGGGFQGGVVAATALHLLYIAVDYRALERIRPVGLYEVGDAAGEAAYVITGLAGVLAGAAFLANVLPPGDFGTVASGGTVVVLNAAVGMEVGCAVVVLLARFLDQAVEIEESSDPAERDRA
ncbi:MnhB domain-containing protein [Streptomyces sp. SAJ15]|uniref:MnhB domain-containing protein n=1 Tax=Streptomyces sp. SAJ15 TaxID=2011095 RepID=UPI001186ED74|nr:MnhB domain-containing protein [Streptomyces sp. SAJ15]TVL93257.1 sodium:proton antiporter [Streptomyces sp. SAJ15]